MADALKPHPGDFVGRHCQTGQWLYICAVNYDTLQVRIGDVDGRNMSEWLNETQAKAQYNYVWGAKRDMTATAQNPLDCPSCGGWPVGLCPCWDAAGACPPWPVHLNKRWALERAELNQYAATNPTPGYPWGAWPGYRYDEVHIPTEPLPEPSPAKCECGSGNHTRSGAHSNWCPLWVSA